MKELILLINNRHQPHIVATHVDAEGVGFFGGKVDLGITGFAGELFCKDCKIRASWGIY